MAGGCEIPFGRRTFLAGLVSTPFAGLVGCATTGSDARRQDWGAVRALAERFVGDRKVAGVVVAVSYRDAPIRYVTAGTPAFDSPVAVDENSLFRIYSMTKQVTGIAAMMLVEDGRLGLDQPLAEVLPQFRSMQVCLDPETDLSSRPARNVITMRHLITHTSGLRYWMPRYRGPLPDAYRRLGITPGSYGTDRGPGFGPQAVGLAEMIDRLATLPLAFEPGTAWAYSLGADVMGAVIERITGSFPDFLEERIFSPLGMASTGFRVASVDAPRLTTNYLVTRDGPVVLDAGATSRWLRPPTLIAGGGGLVSSARDLERFCAMLLGHGTTRGVRVMRPETARTCLSNLLPPGVSATPRGLFGSTGMGALGGVVLPGDSSHVGPAGCYGGGGAAGTLWLVDPARRGRWIFLTQYMPPDTYPINVEVPAAIEGDLLSSA